MRQTQVTLRAIPTERRAKMPHVEFLETFGSHFEQYSTLKMKDLFTISVADSNGIMFAKLILLIQCETSHFLAALLAACLNNLNIPMHV